jgi:hypothetical protein
MLVRRAAWLRVIMNSILLEAPMKKKISPMFKMASVSAIVIIGGSMFVSAQQKVDDTKDNTKQATEVVEQFWQAFAEADHKGLKQNLAWPCLFMEHGGTTFSYRSEAELDKESENYVPNPEEPGNNQPIRDIKLSDMKVQFLNENLAQVTYKCHIPPIQISKTRTIPTQVRDNITVLQRWPLQKTWKIKFTTIPD